ncbi:MAG: S1 RNA-binding domain-containing protein [Planctomycetota bacterium]
MADDEQKDKWKDLLRTKMEAEFKKLDRIPRHPRRGEDEDEPHIAAGVVVSISGEDVFVELGPRTQGVISIREFDPPPRVGETYEFSMVSVKDELWTLSRKDALVRATWKNLVVGHAVKATVSGQNRGGLELTIGPVRAFMPISEIALERVEDLAPYLGQTMLCEIIEVSRGAKKVVLSRRAVLEHEREQAREKTRAALAVGKVVTGRVEKIEPFGAFVDLGGGITGLLHVSNISHQRVKDPADVLTVGQQVEVQILSFEQDGKRIGLGMKQLAADPWHEVQQRYKADQIVTGRVTRIVDFGAFVELEPGVEGLLHFSQISPERVRAVGDAVQEGAEVTVRVVDVDPKKRRLSLSRLTARGALIGSEELVSAEKVKDYGQQGPSSGTNLGALLREALEKKQKKSS